MGHNFDKMKIHILRPHLFRSHLTLRKLVNERINGVKGVITRAIPPLIDPDYAKTIANTTDIAGDVINQLSVSNFVLQLLMNGSLQQLFGMIRALQLIVLSFLIRVPTPAITFSFFQGCAIIAQMDVFDGSGIYASVFEFTESEPINDSFMLLGFNNKNFLINSGSFFIMLALILLSNFRRWLLNSFAVCNNRLRLCRRLGMGNYSQSYLWDIVKHLGKLSLETHFDISMCACLGLIQLIEQNPLDGTRFIQYWNAVPDRMNGVFSIAYTLWVVYFPIMSSYHLLIHFKNLNQPTIKSKLEFLLEENKVNTRMRALF